MITNWGCSDYKLRWWWLQIEVVVIENWGGGDYKLRWWWLQIEEVVITNWVGGDYKLRWWWIQIEVVVITNWGGGDNKLRSMHAKHVLVVLITNYSPSPPSVRTLKTILMTFISLDCYWPYFLLDWLEGVGVLACFKDLLKITN